MAKKTCFIILGQDEYLEKVGKTKRISDKAVKIDGIKSYEKLLAGTGVEYVAFLTNGWEYAFSLWRIMGLLAGSAEKGIEAINSLKSMKAEDFAEMLFQEKQVLLINRSHFDAEKGESVKNEKLGTLIKNLTYYGFKKIKILVIGQQYPVLNKLKGAYVLRVPHCSPKTLGGMANGELWENAWVSYDNSGVVGWHGRAIKNPDSISLMDFKNKLDFI